MNSTLASVTHEQLHAKALAVSKRYHACVSEVLDILQQLDIHQTYRAYECTSLFGYATRHLGFSEDVAVNFIMVARKATDVPALKAKIAEGVLTISKARKICSVLTPETQDHWLGLAGAVPLKELEREVARANPQAAVRERATYVAGDRLRLELGISEACLEKLRLVQDLISGSKQRAATFEDALDAALDGYIDRHDPMKKAERSEARREKKAARAKMEDGNELAGKEKLSGTLAAADAAKRHVSRRIELPPRRSAIPNATLHAVRLRDQSQCVSRDANGMRCENTRWLDVHHRVPVSEGGEDNAENLVLLCRAHHQIHHEQLGLA